MPDPISNLAPTVRTNEQRIGRLENRLDAHLEDYQELRALTIEMQNQMRRIENWRLEVDIYFRQIRWLVVLVVAALVTGLVNILLNLELHVT